jgi:hypothetical protein
MKEEALMSMTMENLLSQASHLGHLPLPPAILHQAIGQAFVDALHGTFLIPAVGLFAAALLVGFLLWQRQPATRTSEALAEAGVLKIAIAQPNEPSL